MKKYLHIILTLALALALAVPALASGKVPNSDSVEITATYDEGTKEIPPVYSLTLEWTTYGTIAYNAGNTVYTWNYETLEYDIEADKGEWAVKDARIDFNVRNRSNRPVDVEFGNPQTVGNVSITGSYDRTKLELKSAAPEVDLTQTGKEQSGQAVYTITGVDGTISSSGVIATIAVTIIGK